MQQTEGTPGFEPGTIRTAAECSTTELRTLAPVAWLNGRALDLGSNGCRFESCRDRLLFGAVAYIWLNPNPPPPRTALQARVAQWKRVGFRSRRLWVRSPPRVFLRSSKTRRRQDSNLRGQSPVDFWSTPLTAWVRLLLLAQKLTPGGTRTHNLWLRKPTPYPLGYRGSAGVSGLVVEWLPATESARVRFPAHAPFPRPQGA